MKPFKFLNKNLIPRFISRRWWNGNGIRTQGQLHWMIQPVGILYYMEARSENGFYEEELKHITIQSYSRQIRSYNQFMERNRDKVIFAYEFVDNTNICSMQHYNEGNFNDMPRDIPLIFRGIIRNYEVF